MIELIYLVAASLFIFGLKLLSSPRTAPRGNSLAATGMFIAVLATLIYEEIVDPWWIVAGLALGGAAGILAAVKVQMTAMPQLVALFNGLGGGASALVAWSELHYGSRAAAVSPGAGDGIETPIAAAIVASTLIGAVTLTGSVIAFAKLQELIRGRPLTYALQKTGNLVLLLASLFFAVLVTLEPDSGAAYAGLLLVSSALGVLSVLPIGGADMPVVISLLNSYSGLAACSTGFVLRNSALIISGSLVGASGIILTQIMCRAMNRSLRSVLFGAFGGGAAGGAAAATAGGPVKSGSPDEAAILLDAANLVVFVPGYGMAVAQAQHAVKELADELTARGVTVKYAIHPVAGRMPGHMNVLLAEADVPYEQLCDMDQINPELSQTDVALIIGANDVTNPAARNDPSSPIYGMPILDVDKARTAIVLKRSLKPGFAGIDNPLYTLPRTMMAFGDAKDTVVRILAALKEI